MKKITLLLLVGKLLISCGKSKGEQMLFDYQQKNVKTLNFDLANLDFKINKVEKVNDITATDSMKYLKLELAKYWTTNPEKSLADTLSFEHVKSVLEKNIAYQDTLHKLHQEAVITAIKVNNYSYELESKRKRDEAIDRMFDFKETLSEVEKIEARYNELSKNPESVLSVKYKANYSLNNPMLGNTKQTFDKVFYTNAAQTAFIKEETVEEK